MEHKSFQTILALGGTALTYFLGGWDVILKALVFFAVVDFVTGWGSAWVNKKLQSGVGSKGIARKVGMFIVVGVASILDNTTGLAEPILRTVTIWFYIANEGLSILENIGEMGVPLPKPVMSALTAIKDKAETSE